MRLTKSFILKKVWSNWSTEYQDNWQKQFFASQILEVFAKKTSITSILDVWGPPISSLLEKIKIFYKEKQIKFI